MGQWSELIGDLVNAIESNLELYIDKIRIRAVCDPWNSHLERISLQPGFQLPFLLQPLDTKNNPSASHALYNVAQNKFYYLDVSTVAQGKVFLGSSHGWLSTIQDVDPKNYALEMHLINPFTNGVIKLPPRIKFPDVVKYCAERVNNEYAVLENFDDEQVDNRIFFNNQTSLMYLMGKVIVSSPPSDDNNYVVVAIYGYKNKLAYCKGDDDKWTPIKAKFTSPLVCGLSDILFHKGKLYGLTAASELVYFDDISTNPQTTVVVDKGPHHTFVYLVESCDGELLMLSREVEVLDGKNPMSIIKTLGFDVYKLDLGHSSWIRVEDIGDDMLFVGYNSSLSLSSCDFPGFKGNCIYFTDSFHSYAGKLVNQEDSDIGVFNMKDGSIEPLPGFRCDPRYIWPPPIWVMPPRL